MLLTIALYVYVAICPTETDDRREEMLLLWAQQAAE